MGFKTCLPTNLLFIRLRFCLPRRLENFGKYCPICWLKVELTGVGFTAGAGASGLRNSASCSKGTANGPSGLSTDTSDNNCFATPPPRPAAIITPRLTGLERDVTAGEVGEAADALTLGLQVDVLLFRPLPPALVDWLLDSLTSLPRTPAQEAFIPISGDPVIAVEIPSEAKLSFLIICLHSYSRPKQGSFLSPSIRNISPIVILPQLDKDHPCLGSNPARLDRFIFKFFSLPPTIKTSFFNLTLSLAAQSSFISS